MRSGGNAGEKRLEFSPFGGEIHAERRFGDLVLPSRAQRRLGVVATPGLAPFFHAGISADQPDALARAPDQRLDPAPAARRPLRRPCCHRGGCG